MWSKWNQEFWFPWLPSLEASMSGCVRVRPPTVADDALLQLQALAFYSSSFSWPSLLVQTTPRGPESRDALPSSFLCLWFLKYSFNLIFLKFFSITPSVTVFSCCIDTFFFPRTIWHYSEKLGCLFLKMAQFTPGHHVGTWCHEWVRMRLRAPLRGETGLRAARAPSLATLSCGQIQLFFQYDKWIFVFYYMEMGRWDNFPRETLLCGNSDWYENVLSHIVYKGNTFQIT